MDTDTGTYISWSCPFISLLNIWPLRKVKELRKGGKADNLVTNHQNWHKSMIFTLWLGLEDA